MAYEALARKYRPRTFGEVVGQKPIVRTLGNAIRANRIHHAYVFSGVRGVGKTTIARILAKALNCEKGPTPEPCLACPPCVEIAAGQDMDVIEMDAASRTGVDDVRELIDTTRYAPARDRYKVFIIDEFHMLSRPAFNALLKTLEEPPPRVVFVMATTELHKVPSTVLSRTQQFDFRKVSLGEIVELLETVAGKESIRAPRACLEMLARASDGSVRDAESLLDQAIATCGNDLDEETLRALLGLVPDETVEAFFAAAADGDAGALVRLIDAVVSEGHDLRVFLGGLIEGGRRLLVIRTVDAPSEILGLGAEHEARLATLAQRIDAVSLLRIQKMLIDLEIPLKQSEQPRYLLEAAAIRIATVADLTPIEDLIARLESGESGPSPGAPSPGPRRGAAPGGAASPGRVAEGSPAPSASSPRPAPPAAPRPAGPRGKPERNAADGDDAGAHPGAGAGSGEDSFGRHPSAASPGPATASASFRANASEDAAAASDSRTGEDADAVRDAPSPDQEAQSAALLELLHEKKISLAVLVEKAVSIQVLGDRLVLLFDDSGSFARKSVEQAANLAMLRDLAAVAFGRKVAIEVARAPKGLAPGRGEGAASTGVVPSRSGAAADAQARVIPPPTFEARPDGGLGLPPRSDRAGASGTSGSPSATGGSAAAHGLPAAGDGPGESAPTLFGDVAAVNQALAAESALAEQEALEDAFDGPAETDGEDGAAQDRGRISASAPPETAAPGEPPRMTGPPAMSEARRQRLLAEAQEDPLVRKIVERFEGRVVEVKEVQ